MGSFSAEVDEWVLETKERINAVFKLGLQITFNQVLDRTPVDTGFLKNSFTGSTTGFLPLVQKGASVTSNVQPIELTIAGLDIGETIYANFTANYAIFQENGARGRAGRHMVKLAVQNWQTNINTAINQIRS